DYYCGTWDGSLTAYIF
nr:immunoglobulin light chain junction region [Macaca mulatta]